MQLVTGVINSCKAFTKNQCQSIHLLLLCHVGPVYPSFYQVRGSVRPGQVTITGLFLQKALLAPVHCTIIAPLCQFVFVLIPPLFSLTILQLLHKIPK